MPFVRRVERTAEQPHPHAGLQVEPQPQHPRPTRGRNAPSRPREPHRTPVLMLSLSLSRRHSRVAQTAGASPPRTLSTPRARDARQTLSTTRMSLATRSALVLLVSLVAKVFHREGQQLGLANGEVRFRFG